MRIRQENLLPTGTNRTLAKPGFEFPAVIALPHRPRIEVAGQAWQLGGRRLRAATWPTCIGAKSARTTAWRFRLKPHGGQRQFANSHYRPFVGDESPLPGNSASES